MTEEAPEEEEGDEGLVFHEGMRLTEMKTKQNLSIEYPKLEPLHHIKVELLFHYYKIRSTWTASHWITLTIGCLAVLLSSWDIGIGELSEGGGFEGFFAIGISPNDAGSGIRKVATASVVLSIISLGLWLILLLRLWSIFPLMRSQAISLYVALFAAQVSQFWAHGYDSRFPLGLESFAFAVAGIGIILITFVGFILQRAVIETRDVHVEEKHWHPDPRQMELAKRDHSLFAWGAALMAYCILIVIHSWSGAHYVAVRQPSEHTGWWIFSLIHLFTGLVIIWLMIHVLWYPQMMLGTGEIRIESDRARQVSKRTTVASSSNEPKTLGKCPNCETESTVMMGASGEIEAICMTEGCNGSGNPGSKCSACGERISSRVICGGCQISAPAADYFPNVEAW